LLNFLDHVGPQLGVVLPDDEGEMAHVVIGVHLVVLARLEEHVSEQIVVL